MGIDQVIRALAFAPLPTSEPLYRQLAGCVAEAIRGGRIAVGTRLPSERQLASALGISRTTATAAYQELALLGAVSAHVGRGTVVLSPPSKPAAGLAWSALASRFAGLSAPVVAPPRADTIAFGDGWLHETLVPREALAASAGRIAQGAAAIGVPAPVAGLAVLREALARGLTQGGLRLSADQLLITGGAQQGLNVVARALLSPGDTVVCERPSWHGAFRAFRAAGAEPLALPMDRDGIDPAMLEDALIRLRPKLVYLIPGFQCPTGRLMSLERRLRVLELCARYRTPILESQVYGDLAFTEAPPPLKALDLQGIVIHQGSASKTVDAALRLGWLVAPTEVLPLLTSAKASLDLSTPTFTQALFADFMLRGEYARQLAAMRAELRNRRDRLVNALRRRCPDLEFETPEGGIYLWVRLPPPIDALRFERAAADRGVSVRAGSHFLPDAGGSSHIRLCFAAPALTDIERGVGRLADALSTFSEQPVEGVIANGGLASV